MFEPEPDRPARLEVPSIPKPAASKRSVAWFWGVGSDVPRLLVALAPASALFAFSVVLFAFTTEPLANSRFLRAIPLFIYPAYLWLIGLAAKRRRSWARPLLLLPFGLVAIQQISIAGGRFTSLAHLTLLALVAIYLYGETSVKDYFATEATKTTDTPQPSSHVA